LVFIGNDYTMKKVLRLTESDLVRLVKRIIKEEENSEVKSFGDYARKQLEKYGFKIETISGKEVAKLKGNKRLLQIYPKKCTNGYDGIEIYENERIINQSELCPDACWSFLDKTLGVKLDMKFWPPQQLKDWIKEHN
jgi:hypothetical protein